jgi:hypothetical protein
MPTDTAAVIAAGDQQELPVGKRGLRPSFSLPQRLFDVIIRNLS